MLCAAFLCICKHSIAAESNGNAIANQIYTALTLQKGTLKREKKKESDLVEKHSFSYLLSPTNVGM
jgi:hypothetical protein